MLLSFDGVGPRYAQITRALGNVIRNGILAPGARLPPTRDLARDLGCSRNIVLLAYEQLVLEGYLVTRQGAGTFVSPELPAGTQRAEIAAVGRSFPMRLSERGRRGIEAAAAGRAAMPKQSTCAINFVYGLCEPDARGRSRLRAAFAATLREGAFHYGSPAGDLELREQLADRIRAARGITRSASQIIVTSGFQQTLDICSRLLLDPGDRVIVEDPGYAAARAVFAGAGAKVIRVSVDGQGLDLAAMPADDIPVRAVYVTPSHQFPTGAVMPAARRYALVEWAKKRRAYIIEDDYDGEFRYAGRPIAALAGLDPQAPVIYCGTFAKSLFPSLRLGYLVVPEGLAAAAASGKWLCDLSSSLLLQRVVARLMATGEYDRHIRRMQRRYRTRRQTLLAALQRHLGAAARVDGSSAGLHVAVWLPHLSPARVPALIAACAARNVAIYSISGHATRPLPHAGLLLGYGLTDAKRVALGVRRLAEAYREVSGGGSRKL